MLLHQPDKHPNREREREHTHRGRSGAHTPTRNRKPYSRDPGRCMSRSLLARIVHVHVDCIGGANKLVKQADVSASELEKAVAPGPTVGPSRERIKFWLRPRP